MEEKQRAEATEETAEETEMEAEEAEETEVVAEEATEAAEGWVNSTPPPPKKGQSEYNSKTREPEARSKFA